MQDQRSQSWVLAPDSYLRADFDKEAIAVTVLKKEPKKFVIPIPIASLRNS